MEFHRVGLCPYVQYYRPVRATPGIWKKTGSFGCYESHRFVAQNVGQYVNRHLVFEDDVQFLQSFDPIDICKAAHDHLTWLHEQNKPWHIYYLGHFPLMGFPTLRKGLYRVWSWALHAYVAHQNFSQLLACRPYAGKSIDEWTAFHVNQYAMTPMCAVQTGHDSDISQQDNRLLPVARLHAALAGNTGLYETICLRWWIWVPIILALFLVFFLAKMRSK
jgi:hypothetical protein